MLTFINSKTGEKVILTKFPHFIHHDPENGDKGTFVKINENGSYIQIALSNQISTKISYRAWGADYQWSDSINNIIQESKFYEMYNKTNKMLASII